MTLKTPSPRLDKPDAEAFAEANRGEQTYFASPITMQSQCKRLGGDALGRVSRSTKTKLIAFTDGGRNVRRLARDLGAADGSVTDVHHPKSRAAEVATMAWQEWSPLQNA